MFPNRHQDLDEQAKKERCQQDQAQSVLRDMIKQELSHKQETDKKTQDLYDDKTRVEKPKHILGNNHHCSILSIMIVSSFIEFSISCGKVVHELNEKHRRLADQQAAVQKRFDDDLRQSKLLEEEYVLPQQ